MNAFTLVYCLIGCLVFYGQRNFYMPETKYGYFWLSLDILLWPVIMLIKDFRETTYYGFVSKSYKSEWIDNAIKRIES